MADTNPWAQFAVADPSTYQQDLVDNAQHGLMQARTPREHQIAMGNWLNANSASANPQLLQQRMVSDRMKQILGNINDTSPENEDPMDHNLRLAHAVSIGLAGVDPQRAMQANSAAVQLEQAKTQQAGLLAETRQREAIATQHETSNEIAKAFGGKLVMRYTDDDGVPQQFGMVDVLDKDGKYRPESQAEMAKLVDDAKQKGVQVTPETMGDFNNARTQAAVASANARRYASDQAAQSRVMAAMIAAQKGSGGLTGNQAMMTYRILDAAALGSGALQNIAELPFGSNTGVFGIGAHSGTSAMSATGGALRNTLSPQDVRQYEAQSAGLFRNIAMIEQQGGLQGGQKFAERLEDKMTLRVGDHVEDVMTKLADARRIIEQGISSVMKNPKLDQTVKDGVVDELTRLSKAIPFTVHDVNAFREAAKADPKLTMQQFMNSRGSSGAVPAVAGGAGTATMNDNLAKFDAATKGGKQTPEAVAEARQAIISGKDPDKVLSILQKQSPTYKPGQ